MPTRALCMSTLPDMRAATGGFVLLMALRYNRPIVKRLAFGAPPATMTRPRVIAIDGPVAAGKTTVGRLLARKLRYRFVDTGVMYRAVTWLALQRKVDLDDASGLSNLARHARIELKPATRPASGRAMVVDGQDVTARLRLPRVERAVSIVSRVRGVRTALVRLQRRMADDGGVVMVGRDIGTVVLPHADIKVYLRASPEERARRRSLEVREAGHAASYETILRDIQRRDRLDSERAVSPLRRAPDARVVNTDGLTLEQVVAEILEMVDAPE